MSDNSALDALKGILGDNADEKINTVLNSLAPSKTDGEEKAISVHKDDSLQYLMQMKGIIDEMSRSENDERSRLLMSLKPFMRSSRQQTIDSAVRLLSLTRVAGKFGKRGL